MSANELKIAGKQLAARCLAFKRLLREETQVVMSENELHFAHNSLLTAIRQSSNSLDLPHELRSVPGGAGQ